MNHDDVRLQWNQAGLDFAAAGFNLLAVIDPGSLPSGLREQWSGETHDRWVLLASAGPRLWSTIAAYSSASSADPFDEYVVASINRIIGSRFPKAAHVIDYPGEGPAPLIALGEALGWSTPSTLGLGIHREYGLWFAYRGLFRIDVPLPVTEAQGDDLQGTCERCDSTECVSACPAGAVSVPGRFDLRRCAEYRLQPESDCAESCFSRLACPVGAEHRYTQAQFAYHQRRSLVGLRAWLHNR